jgi:predicted nucleic acid-binding protein
LIFLDTSGVIALADDKDIFHTKATEMFEASLQAGEEIVLHNYLVVESAALLHRRLSRESSLKFLRESRTFSIVWVDKKLHNQAEDYLAECGSSKLSLVDVLSFLVMRPRGITEFVGFDKHFVEAGFTQYGSKEPGDPGP